MAENAKTGGIDMGHTAALLGSGSPKGMYVFFLLSLCKNFFESMRDDPSPRNIDSATLALVAFCPNRVERERLFKFYGDEKGDDNKNTLSASVKTVGELMSYLSETLEFEETATGGYL
jgi:hypothetical protein